jgi:hypothetical protein
VSRGGRDVAIRAAAAKVTAKATASVAGAGVGRGAGKAGRAAAAGVPVAVLAIVVMLVAGIVPTSGMGTPDFPPVEPSDVAGTEIPAGYMDAYRRADEDHRVPWPVLAAMGQVLTDHGARSPYDTLQRSDEQRFPTVDPPIAPGAAPGAEAGGCRLRIVGDSLLAGMEGDLTPALSTSCASDVDAREGRTIAQGTEALTADPPADATAVVVVLGTNDLAVGATRDQLDGRIDDLVAAATAGRPDRPVVWATSAATGLATDRDTLAAALAAARGRHPTLQVADWAAHPDARPDAGDGVHYTPAGYQVMAGWLAGQLAAPAVRAVDPPAGDGGLGPLLLNPTVFTGLSVQAAQGVTRSVDLLAAQMARTAERTRTRGADDARASRFAEEFLPASEEFWHEVVAAAPVVAGDSACLQPDPTLPVPQIIEVVWRCEMLRTPPTLWTPDGMVAGADAQDRLLGEAHTVAATWSDRGARPCDEAEPYAGVFPVPATAQPVARCDPVQNVRTAARLVLDQESRPFEQRPGATDWERAAAGWATMPPALGDPATNRFTAEGPPIDGFTPGDTCEAALALVLDAEAVTTPDPYTGLAPMAGFEPGAVDFDPARWDARFATTPLDPLVRPGAPCDPGTDRAAGFEWLAGRLAARRSQAQARGEATLPGSGLAGAIAYAEWTGARGAFPLVGQTGLVPRLHNPRLVPPRIDRPPVTGGATPVNPREFADRVIAKAKVYAGYATAVPVDVSGWEALAALGIPEHAARAYVQAVSRIGVLEPGCAVDVAYLAGFGFMESGHGTVAVDTATGTSDGPGRKGSVTWDPLTGESTPVILGTLLDGSGAGGNTTPYPNDLGPADRSFYRQSDRYLRAVGPTQFLPSTWEGVRAVADGNDDGVADPFNYYDGAVATAVKTCRDGHGLGSEADQRRAALAYNGAGWYADGVLSKAAEYRAGLAAMGLGDPDAPPGRSVVLPDGPVTIVDVYGIQVNAAIAERVRSMVDAARASGLELAEGSGGWRSPERQVELRRSHCGTSDYAVYQMPPSQCSPPTARPGTSEHERGLAIDFRCNGESIGQHERSNPCVVWLRAHAATYGLYNLPSEAWHWSTSGR